jgi:hypothetical protein
MHRELILEYPLLISSGAVAMAEANGETEVARRELRSLIKCWGTSMSLIQLLRHFKWYFNLTINEFAKPRSSDWD